jgi:colicin import membrane protein
MKKLIFLILLFCSFIGFSQSKTEMKTEIESLKKQVETLSNEVKAQKYDNEQLKSFMISKLDEMSNALKTFQSSTVIQPSETATEPIPEKTGVISGRCKATTQAGTQCKRNASEGSEYCWQHQGYGGSKSTIKSSSSSSGSSSGTSTGSGRTILTGPRGGKYYINKNGNKTYIKH